MSARPAVATRPGRGNAGCGLGRQHGGRFSIDVQGDKSVKVEEDLDAGVVAELRARGHDVTVARAYDRVGFGGGQVVSRDAETGVLRAGTEPRQDGAALGW